MKNKKEKLLKEKIKRAIEQKKKVFSNVDNLKTLEKLTSAFLGTMRKRFDVDIPADKYPRIASILGDVLIYWDEAKK